MKRAIAFFIAGVLIAGCNGGNRLVPAPGQPALTHGVAGLAPQRHRRRIPVRVRVRINKHRREDRVREEHPSTISSLTQSLTIAVNGAAPATFNATATSPGCGLDGGSIVCTFVVNAPIGTDSFAVTTFPNTNAGGVALDYGVATVPIVVGQANAVALTLGPVVTTTADTGAGSLRYAVQSARIGDTVLFLLHAGSTIDLSSPISIGGTVTLAGPGAADVSISGGNAHQLFNVSGTATIAGLTLTQGSANVASTPGGIVSNSGTLTLANDVLSNSTSVEAGRHRTSKRVDRVRHPRCTDSYYIGGALYNDGSLNISGTTFSGNFVPSSVASCVTGQGGAIYNDVEGILVSSGDTYANNAALDGGAVYNASVGNVSFTGDAFTGNSGCTAATGCPTTNCDATGCTSAATGSGSAIFDDGAGVTIASSTFTNNVAGGPTAGSSGFGGALFLGSGAPSITGSTFSGNLAGGGTSSCSSGEGGAILAQVPFEIDNDTFANNTAAGDLGAYGGAIEDFTTVTGSNDSFTSNKASAPATGCNTAVQAQGGALYAMSATLRSSTFTGNTVVSNRGAAGGAINAISQILSGDTFTSNSVTAAGLSAPSTEYANGGAVAANSLTMHGCSFTSNSATATSTSTSVPVKGGAVATEYFSSSGDAFTSNTATLLGGPGNATGGALDASGGGSIVVSGDTFKSNAATATTLAEGGAFHSAGSFTASGSTFTSNTVTAASSEGGAIGYDTGPGSSSLVNDTFASNAAVGPSSVSFGGAIFDAIGASISNSSLSGNVARTEGGGIYSGGNETLSADTFSANVVTTASELNSGGGGAYIVGIDSITASSFVSNVVTVGAGNLSGGGGIYVEDTANIFQSTFAGNSVQGNAGASGGGAIFSYGTLNVTNSTITGNSSAIDGGGIENTQPGSLLNVTLYQNAATGSGGNLFSSATITLANSIVADGSAANGPDIDNTSTITSGDYNLVRTAVAGNPLSGTLTHEVPAGVDPALLPLANNGGPTLTNADQSATPEFHAIPFTGGNCGGYANSVDQRGYARGNDGSCDIGAYEFSATPSAIRAPAPRYIRTRKPINPANR